MDFSFKVLVVTLSAVLAVFLLLAIVTLIKVIQVLNDLKRITKQAEKLTDSAEAIGEFFRKSTEPFVLGRFISNIANIVIKHKQANKRGKDNE